MTLRIALLLSVLVPAPVFAQAVAAPAAAQAPKEELVRVALDTDKGRIVLALDRGRAPVTTANFLRYVDARRFDGVSFYRAMPYGNDAGLIQGGITRDARMQFEAIAHEPSSRTGLRHEAGAISMANIGPGTAKSDFFILTGPIPAFDESFAAFGRVVEGMDVVKAILAAPTDPNKGVGVMKGQMLAEPIVIKTARRVDAPR